MELLPDDTDIVIVEIPLVHYRAQLEPYQEKRWNLGEERKTYYDPEDYIMDGDERLGFIEHLARGKTAGFVSQESGGEPTY